MVSPYAAIKYAAPNLFQKAMGTFFSANKGMNLKGIMSTTVNNLMAPGGKGKVPWGMIGKEFGGYSSRTMRDLFIAQPNMSSMGYHAAGWAAEGFIASSLYHSFKVQRPPEMGRIGPMMYGSGYISWSKNSGMPADHLSTNGLSLALSNTRHTSVI